MFRRPERLRKTLLTLVSAAGVALALFGLPLRARLAQGPAAALEAKLRQRATFIPQDETLLEQLIKVAQQYRIPMGIELPKAVGAARTQLRFGGDATVQELLSAIVSQSPDLRLTVADGLVHVGSPAAASDPRNVLNLRLDKYCVKDRNIFQAEQALRLKIEMELHPDEYSEGFISSYGYPHGHPLARKKLTLCRPDVAVREVLDGLAEANGNALWVAELDGAQAEPVKSPSPARARQPESAPAPQPKPWRFLPLQNTPDN
jgi:hypothetical protein